MSETFSAVVRDPDGVHRAASGTINSHQKDGATVAHWDLQGSGKSGGYGPGGSVLIGTATADNLLAVVPHRMSAEDCEVLDSLHATVEDTDTTAEDRREARGEYAAMLGVVYDQRMGPWEDVTRTNTRRRRSGAPVTFGPWIGRPTVGERKGGFGLALNLKAAEASTATAPLDI